MSAHRAIINRALSAPRSLAGRIRTMRLRLLGAKIGRRCWIRKISIPRNPWDICIEHEVALDDGVTLLASGDYSGKQRILIGRGTYVNRWTFIDASESVTIGSDAMIGPGCYITDHDHGRSIGELVKHQALVSAPTHIGPNAWLGAGVTVLKGVEIGSGAVIGAGALVTRSVPAGETWAGVPARRLTPAPEATERSASLSEAASEHSATVIAIP